MPDEVKNTEEAQPTTKEVETKESDQPVDKEFVNPHARARILERDKSILESRVNFLTEQLINMAQAPGYQQEIPQEDEPDEDDWQADPLAVIHSEIRTLRNQIAENKKEQNYNQSLVGQAANYNNAIAAANTLIQEKLAADPDAKDAFLYMVKIIQDELVDEFPGFTERELYSEAERRINAFKVDSVSKRKNPADEIVKRAKRFGYKAAPKKDEDKSDAKAVIEKGKVRDNKSRTVSTLEGSSLKGRPNFAKMKEEEFNRVVSDSMKEGKMKKGPGAYRTPSMRDLIGHKGVEVG